MIFDGSQIYHNYVRLHSSLNGRTSAEACGIEVKGNDESAQEFAEAYRIYHNFVRPHTGLPDNITSAQASGIDLGRG